MMGKMIKHKIKKIYKMLLDCNIVYDNLKNINDNYIDIVSSENRIKFIKYDTEGYYYSLDKEIPIAINCYEKNADHILREYIVRIKYMKFKESQKYDIEEKKRELVDETNHILYRIMDRNCKIEKDSIKYKYYNRANNNEPISKLFYPLKIFDINGIFINTIYVESMRLIYFDYEFWSIFFLDNGFTKDNGLYILPEESFEAIKIAMDIIHYGNTEILIPMDLTTSIQLKNFISRFSNSLFDPLKIYLDNKISLYDQFINSFQSTDYFLQLLLKYSKEYNSKRGSYFVGPPICCIDYDE